MGSVLGSFFPIFSPYSVTSFFVSTFFSKEFLSKCIMKQLLARPREILPLSVVINLGIQQESVYVCNSYSTVPRKLWL